MKIAPKAFLIILRAVKGDLWFQIIIFVMT